MTRLTENPRIPEGINASQEHPLKEFSLLLAGIALMLVMLVIGISVLAQFLAPQIPFRWEQQLTQFDPVVEELIDSLSSPQQTLEQEEPLQEGRGTSAKAHQLEQQAQEALQTLVAELAQVMDLPDGMNVQVHLLEQAAPNAFATLGGHIFVTHGLIASVSSENALAMVLAHEIAHVKFRHPIQALSRGALLQFVMLAVTGAQGGAELNRVLGQTGLLTLLSFNRDMERAADTEAMSVLVQRYGHLHGASEFFAQMLSREGDAGWRAAFESHPATQERVDRIMARAQSHQGATSVLPLDARFLRLQASRVAE